MTIRQKSVACSYTAWKLAEFLAQQDEELGGAGGASNALLPTRDGGGARLRSLAILTAGSERGCNADEKRTGDTVPGLATRRDSEPLDDLGPLVELTTDLAPPWPRASHDLAIGLAIQAYTSSAASYETATTWGHVKLLAPRGRGVKKLATSPRRPHLISRSLLCRPMRARVTPAGPVGQIAPNKMLYCCFTVPRPSCPSLARPVVFRATE
jgi:hypothetical protein